MRRVFAFSRDPDFLDLYTTAFESDGFQALTLDDPSQLSTRLSQTSIDVAVIDVLGERDWSILTALIALDVPAIVVTGWWTPERRYLERAFADGAAAFVVKPVSPPQLVELVRRVLDGERGIDVLPLPR